MHVVLFIISMLFLSLLVSDPNPEHATLPAAISIVTIVFSLLFWRDHRLNDEFSDWIVENRERLKQDGLMFNGILIDAQTEFIQYEVCISVAYISYRGKTAYYVNGHHFTAVYSLFFSMYCLVFGWWALPKGPLNTIKAVIHNIRVQPRKLNSVVNEIIVNRMKPSA
ncbi:hypothetical protein [Paenibacillus sp. OSY-SE]|uniref:hypothetical protein n=1 Tax=Paenibacillus sp. OSY-SE TaxID=1196323 RepID=UPI0002E7CB4B|nr:hypothetical protein [Paenibacillus sp. OSY-SE]